MATLAPSRAARRPMAKPIPREPPVMNRVLPLRLMASSWCRGKGRSASPGGTQGRLSLLAEPGHASGVAGRRTSVVEGDVVGQVREGHRFDVANLEAWMAKTVDGFAGPVEVREFAGGQSNPTYQLLTPGRTYVLRRKPPGNLLPSAHAVDREYRVIAALHPTGFPVARPHALCEDESVIGTAFYVMDYVAGRVLWDQGLPGMTKPERHAIWDEL